MTYLKGLYGINRSDYFGIAKITLTMLTQKVTKMGSVIGHGIDYNG